MFVQAAQHAGLLLGLIFAISSSEISDEAWREMKSQAVHRNREVIQNNDGCDALYYPRGLVATKENLIQQRMINAVGTKVGTYSYCPVSSGFGHLTIETTVGDQLLIDPPHAPNRRNVTGELLGQGTDPLKIAEAFCRENDLELFASLRCNDTHDTSHTESNPYFLFPPYKGLHPQFLMGTYTARPPHCTWSAVDFTHEAIRTRFVALAKELINNYSIDGIELDFCRHLQYFKSVAMGGEASPAELTMMTDSIREIRQFAERVGRQRQRPVLVSVRVPDSAGASKAVGLDIETWMDEGLVDIVIGGFYLQLNRWQTMADLCHSYGVKFYPSLDESRISVVNPYFKRSTLQADNARMAAALQAGVDGIYFFNRYGATQLNNMAGNMDDIRLRNKNYFITYRNHSLTHYLATAENYNTIRNLSPENSVSMTPGVAETFCVEFGDDMTRADVLAANPNVTVSLLMSGGSGNKASVTLNDHPEPLQLIEFVGNQAVYSVPLDTLVQGSNNIAITAVPDCEQNIQLDDVKVELVFGERATLNIEPIAPNNKFRFDVMDGTLPIANLKYTYDTTNMQVVAGDNGVNALQLKHLSGEPYIAITDPALQQKGAGLLLARWKMKYQTEMEGMGGFSVVFNPKNPNSEILHCPIKFFADKIEVPWGTIALSETIQDRWITFHLLLDIEKEHAVFMLEDEVIGEGAVHEKTTTLGTWFGDGSGEIAGQMELEYLEVTRSPVWKFKFDVADNTIRDLDNITYEYETNNMQVVAGENNRAALRLTHLTGYQLIKIEEPALVKSSSGILLAEWKMRYRSGVGSSGGFQIVFKPKNKNYENIFCPIKFFADKIEVPWGTIALSESLQDRWATFYFLLDVHQEVASLWLDGVKIGEGSVPNKTPASEIWFGDGSGSVAGEVDLEYLKITTVE